MKRLTSLILSLALVVFSTLPGGCEAPPRKESPFERDVPEAVLVVGMDTSGSYADKRGAHYVLGPDAKAFTYVSRTLDRYFRAHSGSKVRVIIFQISGANAGRGLLWDGSAQTFRRKFPTGPDFQTYLKDHSDPSGSRVYGSTADALEYLLSEYPSQEATKAVVLAFSDTEDNDDPAGEHERRLQAALRAYGKRGGALAMFWVRSGLVGKWRGHLKTAGVRHEKVVDEIVPDPELPDWE